jgi:hypothetical protein
MSQGPGAGAILIGIFLILFGLCIALVGGGCTVLLVTDLNGVMKSGDGVGFLLLSLVTLAGGLGLLWVGVKLLRGGYRNG